MLKKHLHYQEAEWKWHQRVNQGSGSQRRLIRMGGHLLRRKMIESENVHPEEKNANEYIKSYFYIFY